MLAMLGVIASNLRMIAMMTLVTLLIEPERRDRANGLVGMATRVTMLSTSVISGLLALNSRYYRQLSTQYAKVEPPPDEPKPEGDLLPGPASDPRL